MHVRIAQQLSAHCQPFPPHALRLRKPALRVQDFAQLVKRGRDLRVLIAKQLSSNRQGLAIQGLRVLHLALIHEQAAEVLEASRDHCVLTT